LSEVKRQQLTVYHSSKRKHRLQTEVNVIITSAGAVTSSLYNVSVYTTDKLLVKEQEHPIQIIFPLIFQTSITEDTVNCWDEGLTHIMNSRCKTINNYNTYPT